MSALPKAVQKQIARADQLAAEVNKPAAAETPATPNDSTPAPAPAPVAAAPAPAPAAAPAPAPIPAADWEHRYKVLQGKYNAEVPRLQEQTREQERRVRLLEDQLTAQQQLLASLGSQRPAVAGSNGAAPAPTSKLVKDEEIREFGSDLYDFIQRTAKESVLPEVDRRFEHQLKPVAAQVAQTASAVSAQGQAVAKSAEERVLQQLASEVPNWDVLDADPGFLAWLDQYDPYSGSKRGELLNQAYKRHDGPRVVAFFKGYLNENAAVTPTPTPAPAAPAPQVSLDSLTAPGAPKAGTAGAQEGAGKRIWTRAEIKQHYRDVQLGKFSKRLDAARQIEADIFAAQREGRIR